MLVGTSGIDDGLCALSSCDSAASRLGSLCAEGTAGAPRTWCGGNVNSKRRATRRCGRWWVESCGGAG